MRTESAPKADYAMVFIGGDRVAKLADGTRTLDRLRDHLPNQAGEAAPLPWSAGGHANLSFETVSGPSCLVSGLPTYLGAQSAGERHQGAPARRWAAASPTASTRRIPIDGKRPCPLGSALGKCSSSPLDQDGEHLARSLDLGPVLVLDGAGARSEAAPKQPAAPRHHHSTMAQLLTALDA